MAKLVTIVDDEPGVLDMLFRAAQSWNYDCQSADSAEAALELLNQRPTPIVVTDLNMPGQGGIWLVREIHRRWLPDRSRVFSFIHSVKPSLLGMTRTAGRRSFVSGRASKP